MKDDPISCHVQTLELKVTASDDFHCGRTGRASAISGANDNWYNTCPNAVLLVVGNKGLGIDSHNKIDSDALDECAPNGNTTPRLGELLHGLIPHRGTVGVIPTDWINPDVQICTVLPSVNMERSIAIS